MTTTDTAVQALTPEHDAPEAPCWLNHEESTQWQSGWETGYKFAADRALRAPPVLAPTFAQLNSACMSYRHDFGLMSNEEQKRLRWLAKEWLHAWRKEAAFAAAPPAPKEAP